MALQVLPAALEKGLQEPETVDGSTQPPLRAKTMSSEVLSIGENSLAATTIHSGDGPSRSSTIQRRKKAVRFSEASLAGSGSQDFGATNPGEAPPMPPIPAQFLSTQGTGEKQVENGESTAVDGTSTSCKSPPVLASAIAPVIASVPAKRYEPPPSRTPPPLKPALIMPISTASKQARRASDTFQSPPSKPPQLMTNTVGPIMRGNRRASDSAPPQPISVSEPPAPNIVKGKRNPFKIPSSSKSGANNPPSSNNFLASLFGLRTPPRTSTPPRSASPKPKDSLILHDNASYTEGDEAPRERRGSVGRRESAGRRGSAGLEDEGVVRSTVQGHGQELGNRSGKDRGGSGRGHISMQGLSKGVPQGQGHIGSSKIIPLSPTLKIREHGKAAEVTAGVSRAEVPKTEQRSPKLSQGGPKLHSKERPAKTPSNLISSFSNQEQIELSPENVVAEATRIESNIEVADGKISLDIKVKPATLKQPPDQADYSDESQSSVSALGIISRRSSQRRGITTLRLEAPVSPEGQATTATVAMEPHLFGVQTQSIASSKPAEDAPWLVAQRKSVSSVSGRDTLVSTMQEKPPVPVEETAVKDKTFEKGPDLDIASKQLEKRPALTRSPLSSTHEISVYGRHSTSIPRPLPRANMKRSATDPTDQITDILPPRSMTGNTNMTSNTLSVVEGPMGMFSDSASPSREMKEKDDDDKKMKIEEVVGGWGSASAPSLPTNENKLRVFGFIADTEPWPTPTCCLGHE
ncbi:hypothetical protein HDU97_000096 [Phlyctochytrium planicorne]|nr:hypothetical protein HDU97_000096 [Phlyctochytrium planicorne]